MNLAHQALWMLVLLVSATVAVLPVVLKESSPQAFSAPMPRSAQRGEALWLVETARGQWLVNGIQVPSKDLGYLLQRRSIEQPVHYLPSDALPFERVSQSMRWLKDRSPAAIVLELPSEETP